MTRAIVDNEAITWPGPGYTYRLRVAYSASEGHPAGERDAILIDVLEMLESGLTPQQLTETLEALHREPTLIGERIRKLQQQLLETSAQLKTALETFNRSLGASETVESCWHCHDVLLPQRPRCERCPDECDVLGCDAPGCAGP